MPDELSDTSEGNILDSEDEQLLYGDPTSEDFIGENPIAHYMDLRRCKPIGKAEKKTYGEQIEIVLKNFKDAPHPMMIFRRIFNLLIGRLCLSSAFKGKPRFISVQISNPYFESPFYIPFRFDFIT